MLKKFGSSSDGRDEPLARPSSSKTKANVHNPRNELTKPTSPRLQSICVNLRHLRFNFRALSLALAIQNRRVQVLDDQFL